MREKIAQEHMEVIKTMLDAGMIDKQTAQTVRGNVIKLATFDEREEYLKKTIQQFKPK